MATDADRIPPPGERRVWLGRLRRRRVAVVYGGPSAERAVSVVSARAVRNALRRMGVSHCALDLSPQLPGRLKAQRVNLVYLAAHGPLGEDGRVQGLLDVMGIPYTGSGVRASATGLHKPTAKRLFEAARIPTPRWVAVTRKEFEKGPGTVDGFARLLRRALVVKPASQGSALGVSMVSRPGDLRRALKAVWTLDETALVEERVAGTEITVGILDDSPLPVVEIVPEGRFYDFHSKYAPGGSRHIIPARLPEGVRRRAQGLALAAHRALDCRHLSRVDFIVRRGCPFLLEVNTLPGMTPTSLFPEAARAVGLSFDDLTALLLHMAVRDAA